MKHAQASKNIAKANMGWWIIYKGGAIKASGNARSSKLEPQASNSFESCVYRHPVRTSLYVGRKNSYLHFTVVWNMHNEVQNHIAIITSEEIDTCCGRSW